MEQKFAPAVAATSKWRTPEDAPRDAGLIGPNAILQLLPVIDHFGGPERLARLLSAASIREVPNGDAMIPEADAARLHRQLRLEEPDLAPRLAARAGRETANYILAHRIPRPVQWMLKALPKGPSARLLSRAIAQHAWTFVGSGRFYVRDPWCFEIEDNPLIRGETSTDCLCHWHVAVFERLYQSLVAPSCQCLETHCAAQGPDNICRFQLCP